MKITHKRLHCAGLFRVVNTYYNDQSWISVQDDYGNLVRVNKEVTLVSLG